MYQCINKTGINLAWLCKRVRITTAELAMVLNEDAEDIKQWENGEAEPGKDSFQRLCDFFEMDKSVILLLDISETDLFTARKELSVKKKLRAAKRYEGTAFIKSPTSTYH